ncbi:SEC-C domain-containing protein, partial [Candidatus Woesebacteria bacterium]|nr:SEC-C domain-containing protein [Candidatus Woesebacteria bacterium]
PVLVGTTSIDKNEYLSRLLHQKGVPHELLNAKNHEREAHIISQAGIKHAVTVATNMAGRGVDIVLGGEIDRSQFKSDADYEKAKTHWQTQHDEILKLGGLYVIGTERHESRRIDNQLRGRSGRQGDSGETQFYVSLEDDVMRIFGGEQIANMMTMLKFPEDQPLSHGMVSRAIEQAQMKVEGFNFDSRKHLVEYDDVLNRQRDIVYSLRRKILNFPEADPKAFKETVYRVIREQVMTMSSSFFALKESDEEVRKQFEDDVAALLDVKLQELDRVLQNENAVEFESYLIKQAEKQYQSKEKQMGEEIWNQVVRSIFLSTIDQFWTQHLTAIDDLRQGINLRGYAQLDPLVEYKNEAFMMFEKLLGDINYESVRRVMKVELQKAQNPQDLEETKVQQRPMKLQAASAVNPFKREVATQEQGIKGSSDQESKGTKDHENKGAKDQRSNLKQNLDIPVRKQLGRNEPCWCGSGKKFKKCHYPEMG